VSFTAPPLLGKYGYACKTWIASELEKTQFDCKYYVWFALKLNPVQNGDSSNPLLLYRELDTAVKKKDVNHTKIKDHRATLLMLVLRFIKPKDSQLARQLKREILHAPIEMFHPQIWRLDLSRLEKMRWNTSGSMPGWDEQFIEDLASGEFEIVTQ
jgi:hypothetical protein